MFCRELNMKTTKGQVSADLSELDRNGCNALHGVS